MIKCNVKGVAHIDEPTQRIITISAVPLSSTELFSLF